MRWAAARALARAGAGQPEPPPADLVPQAAPTGMDAAPYPIEGARSNDAALPRRPAGHSRGRNRHQVPAFQPQQVARWATSGD